MERLDYVPKQLDSLISFLSLYYFFYCVTTTLSMLLLQQHLFNSVKIKLVFGTFKLCKSLRYVIIRLILVCCCEIFLLYGNYIFLGFLIFLIILEISYLLVRSNYVNMIQVLCLLGLWITCGSFA